MSDPRTALLREQFDLVWALFEHHAERMEPADFLWEPAPVCWTVRQQPDGRWLPDWADTEPDPPPIPTAAWASWHIGWWWSVTLDHAQGRTPRARETVTWPGDGPSAVAWLRELRTEWRAVLEEWDTARWDAEAPFPWPPGSGHTVADMAAWVNAELMKNVAEIGQLRLLRAALAH